MVKEHPDCTEACGSTVEGATNPQIIEQIGQLGEVCSDQMNKHHSNMVNLDAF